MKQLLINLLENICPDNVYLQGTLNPDEEYPETFLTFFTNDVPEIQHLDNDVTAWAWHFSVILYSADPNIIDNMPTQIIRNLKQAGFIAQGKGQDIPSDEPTHTGWAMEFIKIEYL